MLVAMMRLNRMGHGRDFIFSQFHGYNDELQTSLPVQSKGTVQLSSYWCDCGAQVAVEGGRDDTNVHM